MSSSDEKCEKNRSDKAYISEGLMDFMTFPSFANE